VDNITPSRQDSGSDLGRSLGRILGGADAVSRSNAGSRTGDLFPAAEPCSSIETIPSRRDTRPLAATLTRRRTRHIGDA